MRSMSIAEVQPSNDCTSVIHMDHIPLESFWNGLGIIGSSGPTISSIKCCTYGHTKNHDLDRKRAHVLCLKSPHGVLTVYVDAFDLGAIRRRL